MTILTNDFYRLQRWDLEHLMGSLETKEDEEMNSQNATVQALHQRHTFSLSPWSPATASISLAKNHTNYTENVSHFICLI